MKRLFKILSLTLGALLLLVGCDLTENIQVKVDKHAVFGSASGLELYSRSFYRYLPSLGTAYRLDAMCDYAAVSNVDTFIKQGAYNAETDTNWSWGELKNINYFIDGCNDLEVCTVEESIRRDYLAIARWFRARFYYEKLKKYGEVPWFENNIQSYEYDIMYKDRSSRDEIIENIIADLDYAYENMSAISAVGASTITRWTAAALKSRVCLFEASFRRYHQLEGLTITPEELYAKAADAADKVIKNSGHSLNTLAGSKGAYRELFYREVPNSDEVMLAVCANSGAGLLGTQNWWYNSRSYGLSWSLVKDFVNTYLTQSGVPFTDLSNYSTKSFDEEMADRDLRLEQTIRGLNFTWDGKSAAPNIKDLTLTGYQVIKHTLDESKYDGGAKNINSIPIMRYSEVLLNYAEAKAELGELTNEDWALSIGALRRRAGITGGNEAIPSTVDPYLKSNFYPNVTDAAIMEIRRERAIELVAEGLRFDDLRRWKVGELLADLPWMGMHIEDLDVAIDANKDGKYDYYFTEGDPADAPSAFFSIVIEVNKLTTGLHAVPNSVSGYDLVYVTAEQDRHWYSDGRQYLYPIPAKVIRDYEAEGYSISQNPNWE